MTDLMGGLDNETLHALLGSIGDPAQLDDLKDQLMQARKLRNVEVAPTIDSSPSHIPNIAGQITGMFDRHRGAQEEAQARADRDAVYARQAGYSEKFLKALQDMRNGAASPVPGQAGTLPAPNSGNYSI